MVAVCLSFELWLLFVCSNHNSKDRQSATITQKRDKQQPQLKRQTNSNHNSKDRQSATITQKTDKQQSQLKRQKNSNVCLLSYGCCLSVF
jgi:hypothetical protein